MAKNRLNDFSTTADSNTDITGIGIQGTNSPSNLDDAIRALMKVLADWRDGTTLKDTANFNDPDDATKVFRTDAGNIPTATTRVIDAERAYQIVTGGARPLAQTFLQSAGSGTHTFNTKADYYRVFMMGAGGDGGNADGQGAGTGAAASGGNSGNWGWSDFIAIGSAVSATYVVGAAGTAATGAADNGCNGNDTTWTDGTNSFTCKGGKGGIGRTAGGSYGVSAPVANAANTGTLRGTYKPGDVGQGGANFMMRAPGASTPYGTCLPSGMVISTAEVGANATGNGAGGEGAAAHETGGNAVGGRGAPGMIIVEEF